MKHKSYHVTHYDLSFDFGAQCSSLSQVTKNPYCGRVDVSFRIEEECNEFQLHASPIHLHIQGVKLEQNRKSIECTFHQIAPATSAPNSEASSSKNKKKNSGAKSNASKKSAKTSSSSDELSTGGSTSSSAGMTLDDSIVTISTKNGDKLSIGKAKLTISFISRKPVPLSSDALTGLYYCKGSDLMQTHFEPQFAHTVFPCIDTFEAKATFALTLTNVPREKPYMYVSNGSLERQMTGGSKSTATVVFKISPIMAPYLLYFGIASFSSLEFQYNNQVPMRVLYQNQPTVNSAIALFVQETCLKAMPILEDLFDYTYAEVSEKIDLLLVPESIFGGMEHWNCITLHATESGIGMSDRKKQKEKQDAFLELIVHELAHFFVGNLVGFPIHIKEGLAQYYEKTIADVMLGRGPSFNLNNTDTSLVLNVESNKRMKDSDSKSIQQQMSDMFNGMSYAASLNSLLDIIRRIGVERFKTQMQQLLREHANGYMSQEEFLHFLLS